MAQNKKSSSTFVSQKRKNVISVIPVTEKTFDAWLKKQSADGRKRMTQAGFQGGQGKVFTNDDYVVIGVRSPLSIFDMGLAVQIIRQNFSSSFLQNASFVLESKNLDASEIETAFVGWGLGCYQFSAYKTPSEMPVLLWDKKADKERITVFLESITLLRDLVNTPSNDMGPAELEKAAKALATSHKAKNNIISGKELKSDFPLIHAVGMGSPRAPRLIEITWGNAKDPKLTLVGKGVCFDTGGLNLKPTSNMALMKKDMGGAAHALALGNLIMSSGLKVRLRILIPAVENSVSGESFRPGDIFTSRKGLTVENTNTDAEGRLILADTLTYACEEKTDLLIDFATLTGSARAALGPDIPALFSNNERLAEQIKIISFGVEDPLWPMPLWQPYHRHNDSSVADMHNSSGVPGDLMYSALFLERFLLGKPDWVHVDVYAWEHTGKPGRPRGGADTGLRAMFAMIEERYG